MRISHTLLAVLFACHAPGSSTTSHGADRVVCAAHPRGAVTASAAHLELVVANTGGRDVVVARAGRQPRVRWTIDGHPIAGTVTAPDTFCGHTDDELTLDPTAIDPLAAGERRAVAIDLFASVADDTCPISAATVARSLLAPGRHEIAATIDWWPAEVARSHDVAYNTPATRTRCEIAIVDVQ